MADKTDLLAMQNCVCFNLRRAARSLTQFYHAELRRHGVHTMQTSVLSALAAKSGWTMEELSNFLGMERTTLVRGLQPLRRDGFIKIDGGGRGSRVALSLTSKGMQELENLQPAWRSAQRAVLKTLGEERWAAILSDLDRASSALNPA